MSDGLLQKLVQEDFGYDNGSGKWGRSESHDSLVINEEDQTWFWNSRGIRGDIYDYLVLVRGMSKTRAKEFARSIFSGGTEAKESVYTPYEPLVNLMWENGKNKRDYWYNRCLRDDTIDRYRLGHYNGWNLIPFYENGNFVNFQMRRDLPSKRITRWYRDGKTLLFNDAILPFTKKIYITEGTVDAILLNQEGLPAVSPNGTNTWQVGWFDKFIHISDITYIADNDNAGMLAARIVATSLGTERVKIVTFTGMEDKFDTVDFFRKVGKADDFKEYVKNYKYLYEMEMSYGNNTYRARRKSSFDKATRTSY